MKTTEELLALYLKDRYEWDVDIEVYTYHNEYDGTYKVIYRYGDEEQDSKHRVNILEFTVFIYNLLNKQ